MKRTRTFIYAMVALLSAAFTLQSCLDDDDDNYISIDPDTAVGIVTLKPSQSNDGSWLIQMTDSSFAQCSNIKKYPYGDKECRAYIYFKYDSEPNLTCVLPSITITHIDTLLTKPLAPALESAEANDMAYGNDPVEIVKSWETSAEDGYMNIRFRTNWLPGSRHRVSLVRIADEDGMPTFVFHHDAQGQTGGQTGDGMVAFFLDLPIDTDRVPGNIKIKWKSFTGEKSQTFKYIPRSN